MPSAVARRGREIDLPPEELIPPNYDYLMLTISKVTATYKTASGKNATITMERLNLDEFLVTEGDTGVRWNSKAKKRKYPMDQWEEVYASYRKAGWILFDDQKREKVSVKGNASILNGKQYKPISDPEAASIADRLMGFANQMIEQEYSKTIADVPDWAFDEAKAGLDELARGYQQMSNAEFNKKLTHIFAVLPRRIDVMAKYIAAPNASAEDRAKIIEAERERYDVLHSMLRGGSVNLTGKETILEAYGIQIRAFTQDEENYARKLLKSQSHKFLKGWRVINRKTEEAFDAFCRREHLTESKGIDFLFHGSKHQNWWSILTNGLNINPVGVVITGKAYGYGTYFAPDAVKSLGYTSRAGAKWTSGEQQTGFMGIYKVATGDRYDGHLGCDASLNWEKLQKIQPGAHCTWAERRYSGFMMDEVIVYRNEQSTVWGLLEFSA